MKDKIIAYGKEYIDNFKQNPLSATAILTMQIIFILGWGVYFYYIWATLLQLLFPGNRGLKAIFMSNARIL